MSCVTRGGGGCARGVYSHSSAWSPVPRSAVSLVPRPEDRTKLLSSSLRSFSGLPSSQSLFCTGMLGGGGNGATLVSRGYLSSCSSSTPCFLLCPGLTQPVLYLLCCFNSVPGALSHSILRFSLRLLRCLRGSKKCSGQSRYGRYGSYGSCLLPSRLRGQNPNILIPMSSTLRYAKPYMYRQPFAHTNSFYYSFVPRTISDWNALPSYVTNTTSPASFKNAFISTLS